MNQEQENRYGRHILLEGFGKEGQEKLLKAKVLIIGAGGLGSPCALYLAAAGIGTIGIVDSDTVSLSNLQRQIIHFTPDQDRLKVDSAAEKLKSLNPEVDVRTYPCQITEANARGILEGYDFILECTDSFTCKYLVNDVCEELGKSYCIAGVVKYGGQILTHTPGTLTFRDVFPDPPQKHEVKLCNEVGVLGSAVGTLGTLQATEAIKYFSGAGKLLTNRMLVYDALNQDFHCFEL